MPLSDGGRRTEEAQAPAGLEDGSEERHPARGMERFRVDEASQNYMAEQIDKDGEIVEVERERARAVTPGM